MACALAISRLQFEADKLEADDLISIYMQVQYLPGNQWMEVAAKGTAIRYVGVDRPKMPSEPGNVVISVK